MSDKFCITASRNGDVVYVHADRELPKEFGKKLPSTSISTFRQLPEGQFLGYDFTYEARITTPSSSNVSRDLEALLKKFFEDLEKNERCRTVHLIAEGDLDEMASYSATRALYNELYIFDFMDLRGPLRVRAESMSYPMVIGEQMADALIKRGYTLGKTEFGFGTGFTIHLRSLKQPKKRFWQR